MSSEAPDERGGGPSNRLIAAVAGVALVVVIIAVVVITTQSGGSSTQAPAGESSSSTTARARTVTAPQRNTTTAAQSTTTHTSVAALAPAGGPVPSGFQPQSFTAVSDTTWWLLGDAPCSSPPCTSIVRTADGGRSFVGIPAPRTSEVTGLRFANSEDGYAFGQELWSTHDGGGTWRQVPVSGPVVDLAAGDGYVYAVVPKGLLRSPVGSDHWTLIHAGLFHSVWVQGDAALIDDDDDGQQVMQSSSDHGTVLVSHGSVPALQCDFETTDDHTIWAPCATGTEGGLWVSRDGGAEFSGTDPTGSTESAEPNSAGFAAASGDIAVYGAQGLFRTTDGGASWTQVPGFSTPNTIVAYLGFTDPTHGVAIVDSNGTRESTSKLEITTDAGASYTPVTIASG